MAHPAFPTTSSTRLPAPSSTTAAVGPARDRPPSTSGETAAMTMPFYASAEQIMRDRSEYARKGIARGRGVVVLSYEGGILFVAENPSKSLHKVGEIYDRIGFAAVGRYSEYENLRVAGVRIADTRGS